MIESVPNSILETPDNNSVVINFVGGPGSGKTALCCLLFAELKMRGLKVEYVPEFAKTLVWTQQFELLNNQHYVTMQQSDILKAVYGKVSVVVTDGPIVHGLYYNRHNSGNYCDIEKVENLIIDKMKSFNNIYIHVTKGDFPYEKCGRLESESQSTLIGEEMKTILHKLNLPYKCIVSGRDAITDILDYVLDYIK